MKKLLVVLLSLFLLIGCSPKIADENVELVDKPKFVVDQTKIDGIVNNLLEVERDGLPLNEIPQLDDNRAFLYSLQLVIYNNEYEKDHDDYVIDREYIEAYMNDYFMKDHVDVVELNMLPFDTERNAFVSSLQFGIYNIVHNLDLYYRIANTITDADKIFVEIESNEMIDYVITLDHSYKVKNIELK